MALHGAVVRSMHCLAVGWRGKVVAGMHTPHAPGQHGTGLRCGITGVLDTLLHAQGQRASRPDCRVYVEQPNCKQHAALGQLAGETNTCGGESPNHQRQTRARTHTHAHGCPHAPRHTHSFQLAVQALPPPPGHLACMTARLGGASCLTSEPGAPPPRHCTRYHHYYFLSSIFLNSSLDIGWPGAAGAALLPPACASCTERGTSAVGGLKACGPAGADARGMG